MGAGKKKAFILYHDQKGIFDKLPDEVAGKLIKHIFNFVNGEQEEISDLLLEIAFEPIKKSLERDMAKWDKQLEQRRLAGKRSAEVRKRNATTVNDRSISSTDNVSVSVSDSVSVKENKEYSDEIKNFTHYVFKYFDKALLPKNEKSFNTWCDTIEKLQRIDGFTFQEIETAIAKGRNSEFWSNNFKTVNKLRKKTKDKDVSFMQHFLTLKENQTRLANSTQKINHTSNEEFADYLTRKYINL